MELIIFMGLQASGKSTLYHREFATTHAYVSKDQFRNNKHPTRRQIYLVEEALKAGHSVVIDNTNPRREDRVDLIAIGHAYGAKVIGYFFEVQRGRSLAWNRQRTGKARVPDVAIFVTLKKLTLPIYKEGFDQLYTIRIAESGQFEIIPWEDSETL
jgi:predicted kinase